MRVRSASSGPSTTGGVVGREAGRALAVPEFLIYAVMLVGLFVASIVVGDNGDDSLDAGDAWRYATFLTIGYLISRGLAKAGSREPSWEDGTNEERHGAGGLGRTGDEYDRNGATTMRFRRVQVYGCSPGCPVMSLALILTLVVNACIRLFCGPGRSRPPVARPIHGA